MSQFYPYLSTANSLWGVGRVRERIWLPGCPHFPLTTYIPRSGLETRLTFTREDPRLGHGDGQK